MVGCSADLQSHCAHFESPLLVGHVGGRQSESTTIVFLVFCVLAGKKD
jgi:hypothetical protein